MKEDRHKRISGGCASKASDGTREKGGPGMRGRGVVGVVGVPT